MMYLKAASQEGMANIAGSHALRLSGGFSVTRKTRRMPRFLSFVTKSPSRRWSRDSRFCLAYFVSDHKVVLHARVLTTGSDHRAPYAPKDPRPFCHEIFVITEEPRFYNYKNKISPFSKVLLQKSDHNIHTYTSYNNKNNIYNLIRCITSKFLGSDKLHGSRTTWSSPVGSPSGTPSIHVTKKIPLLVEKRLD